MSNLFTSQTPSLGNVSEAQPVTVGITFYVTSSGQTCKGGRFWVPSTVGAGTFDLVLYSVDTDDNPAASGTGTQLATVSLGSLGSFAGGWSNNVDFPSPVALTANTQAYRIGVRTSEGRYAATGAFFNAGALTNGVITAPQTGTDPVGIGALDNGSFIETITTYPNKTFNGNGYFVDPNVVAASGSTLNADATSTLTLGRTAAATVTRPLAGSLPLTFGATAAMNGTLGVAAALPLSFGATAAFQSAAPPAATGGGWGSLYGVLIGQEADYAEYRARLDNPTECPVHLGIQLDQNAKGVLHCTFGGHIVRRGQSAWS